MFRGVSVLARAIGAALDIRGALVRVAIWGAVGGITAVLSFGLIGFAAAGFYLWVATHWPPHHAAFATAGLLLVGILLACVVGTAAARSTRRRPAADPSVRSAGTSLDPMDLASSAASAATDQADETIRKNPVSSLIAASVAGLVFGLLTVRGRD